MTRCLCPRWFCKFLLSIFLFVLIFKVFYGYYFLFKTHVSFNVESSLSDPYKVFVPSLIAYVGLELFFLFSKKASNNPLSDQSQLFMGRVPYKTAWLSCCLLSNLWVMPLDSPQWSYYPPHRSSQGHYFYIHFPHTVLLYGCNIIEMRIGSLSCICIALKTQTRTPSTVLW